jgi:histidinol-phosphatase
MSGDLDRWVEVAHDLADLADELTHPAFDGAAFDVGRKADGTAVTEIDLAVERRLRAEIGRRLPGHAFLGEEDGLEGAADAPRWVIDPIDGTTNFVKGNPVWATLIACQVDGDEVLGIASAPALGSRWDGVRGGPARRDGRPIRVSDVDRLEAAEVSLGGLSYFLRRGRADLPAALARRTARQRGYGDFWQHCLVASGSTDLAVEAEVELWDLAAVKCIVEAAGGRFSSLRGVPTADGGDALSSNGRLHDAALELIREHHGQGS